MILSDHDHNMFVHMLTQRMRFARDASNSWGEAMNDTGTAVPEHLRPVMIAADEEVRACIREIARMCRFDSDQVNEITGAAWTASKEDK